MPRRGSDDRYRDAGKRRARAPWYRRWRVWLMAVLSVALLVGVAGAGYAYMLNAKLKNIDKVQVKDKLAEEERPDPDQGKALNILLLGSDKGKKIEGESATTTLEQDAKAAEWPVGKYRSDTLIVVHISSDRKHIYLVSIPRDTLTTLYDQDGQADGKGKINEAFADYGPTGAIATVEHVTDLRMRHLAIIDWDGFRSLSTAVGGVPVYIPRAFYDPKQKVQWEAGEQVLAGKKALQYVRTRYGLIRGDFDRIARQQNFLRSLMKKILDKGTMTNPIRLNNTLEAMTKNLTVDAEWSAGDMRGLALSLRGTSSDDVTFLTAPVAGTQTVPVYGSIVNLNQAKSAELFTALREDTMDAYLAKYPDDVLKPEDEIG